MSRTLAILLALALVWMTAWQIAGCSMRRSADEKQIQAAHVETPATRLVPGAEARVEATTVDGPSVTSPYGEKTVRDDSNGTARSSRRAAQVQRPSSSR